MSSRKRRAPGATPQALPQSNLQPTIYTPTQETANISTDQYLNWDDPTVMNGISSSYPDHSLYDGNVYTTSTNGLPQATGNQITPDPTTYSGQLVKRNTNQQLATRGRSPWEAFNGDAGGQQPGWENTDDDEDLEAKALLARKDAQAKRKQIPPFVQKLSSFLDEKKNTNLIRWSDDGNSFIVLDEDEFARTLIPELFKHNNYASFVRQLNMYGFHKKVGLSDNSMKASETKAKAPSEYFNKYFRRGRPELLWLITKPKNSTANPKRKRDDDNIKQGDSDDDGRRYGMENTGGSGFHAVDDGGGGGNHEMAMIPRTEYNSLRNEVRALQQQQKIISGVLNRIRQQNDQLYQQATAFQTLHDRHENSINAILTFLATFYNRSLEGNSGQNIADMFAHAIPQNTQTHGNVVDVGEYPEDNMSKSPQLHRSGRRPLALLPAPAPKDQPTPTGRATTVSSSARSTASPAAKQQAWPSVFKSPVQTGKNSAQMPGNISNSQRIDGNATAPPIKIDTESPSNMSQIPENDEIMSAIHNVNANSSQNATQGPQFDFPAALAHYQAADGNIPLTQQQRNDMLSLIANSTNASSPNGAVSDGNNALVSPQPPTMPSLDQFTATQAQLDLLQKMSEEQNVNIQHLQERLQPLSPSGSIPGLSDDVNGGSYFNNIGDPGAFDLDIDNFIHADDFYPSGQPNATVSEDASLPDFHFHLPDAGDPSNGGLFESSDGLGGNDYSNRIVQQGSNGANSGGRIESVSSAATSPANTVEESGGDEAVRSPKRRRK
ncbi:hypothetical protein K432DRAFT_395747 [Lepidopterella palustris CBS 459.81]|uniref:HSF-type DNA-binding domain-containing protein n=1 Tax=Lepidopterella palustris CBS 459.81 TaxID=1314670 RepID=A0A8E2JCA4_9PEZI|nr:hypothetical protein K432DRAFT_395747 [Lepidopterella palustris CBS 459.81]